MYKNQEGAFMNMDENNSNIRFLSAISYIGVLFVIGRFAVEKDNPDLRFHTYQGGVLFGVFIGLYLSDLLLYLIMSFAPALQIVLTLLLTVAISVAYLVLIVMGMASAIKFEQRLLPWIGEIAVTLRDRIDNNNSFRK